MTEIGSLVLFSTDYERAAVFYRAIGVELDHEDHDGGPAHYAVELGPVHFAIYPAESDGRAPARRRGGSAFPGFFVDSLDTTGATLTEMSVPVLGRHEQMPWGCRMVFEDPDGRPVEINQRATAPERGRLSTNDRNGPTTIAPPATYDGAMARERPSL